MAESAVARYRHYEAQRIRWRHKGGGREGEGRKRGRKKDKRKRRGGKEKDEREEVGRKS